MYYYSEESKEESGNNFFFDNNKKSLKIGASDQISHSYNNQPLSSRDLKLKPNSQTVDK